MRTKKEFKYFSIFNHEKEQEYLRSMHKSGWKFVKVTGLGTYRFEECEPEDVVYQLDYNQEGLEHRSEYLQMFADCGWEYIQDYVGYSYFRKPVSEMKGGEEEIFCDDESRMQMMERVYKGRMIPLFVLFSAVVLPQFVLSMTVYDSTVLSVMYGVIMVLYGLVFTLFASKYYSYRNKKGK